MGSKHNQKSMNEDVDRLSSLPDDLIHKIFSSISTKYVVQASVLSSRWRFIWISIPCLNLSTGDFTTLAKFSEFVEHVHSRRNREIEVSSVKLSFGRKVSQRIVKAVLDYVARCHNIQQLTLSVCLIVDSSSELPLPRFPSLKYLSLSNELDYVHRLKCTTSKFELPALTTLYLHNVDLCNDGRLFSKCANLKNLALKNCGMVESENFSISHPQLSNLTLDNSFTGMMFLNVDAPKLENLTNRNSWSSKYVIKIFAPDLISFVYKGHSCCLSLSTDGFNSLKEADICISKPKFGHSHILSLLEHLYHVKFLTLNKEILEVLFLDLVLLLLQDGTVAFGFRHHCALASTPTTSFFVRGINLTPRLRICPQSISSHGQAPNKSYYLDCSPGSTLEEIVAQNLIVQLGVLLEQEQNNTKTNLTRTEQRKDPIESCSIASELFPACTD